MKGGAEEDTWTGGGGGGGRGAAEIAEKWETLDKMKNGMENG